MASLVCYRKRQSRIEVASSLIVESPYTCVLTPSFIIHIPSIYRVFHNQLYVAVFRVTSKVNLGVILRNSEEDRHIHMLAHFVQINLLLGDENENERIEMDEPQLSRIPNEIEVDSENPNYDLMI